MENNARSKLNEVQKNLRRILDGKPSDKFMDTGYRDVLIKRASVLISDVLSNDLTEEADFMGDSPGQTQLPLHEKKGYVRVGGEWVLYDSSDVEFLGIEEDVYGHDRMTISYKGGEPIVVPHIVR